MLAPFTQPALRRFVRSFARLPLESSQMQLIATLETYAAMYRTYAGFARTQRPIAEQVARMIKEHGFVSADEVLRAAFLNLDLWIDDPHAFAAC
jgi:hypothetical protein